MSHNLMDIYFKSPRFIQTFGINTYEFIEWRLRKSKKFHRCLKLLRETEHWDNEAFQEYTNKHIKKIVEYAYRNVPFYHELYKKKNIDITKIKTVSDLEKLPIITKKDIAQNWHLFLSIKKEKFVLGHSSGTTGTPLPFVTSHNLVILNKANVYRRDLWAGYDGGWIARLVGDTAVKKCDSRPLFRKSYLLKRAIFPTHCLSMQTLPSILEDFQKLNITFLQCYPSSGYLLAKFLEITDKYFPLKAVLYSSEPLLDFQRDLIEERFTTKMFGYYGQAEGSISATECEKEEYHLTMIDGILEIVNNYEKVVDGKKGFSIVTSLHNYAMPLIRYALNDYTGYKLERCSCNRKSSLIYPIETKIEDFIITPSGQILSPSILTFPFKHVYNIIESQMIQKTIDRIIVKIVPGEKFNNSDEIILVNSLKQIIGPDISLKIEYVKNIYQTKNYKKRFIINEMGKDYIEKAFEKIS